MDSALCLLVEVIECKYRGGRGSTEQQSAITEPIDLALKNASTGAVGALWRKVVLDGGRGYGVKVGHGWDHWCRVEGWAAASEWTVVDARV